MKDKIITKCNSHFVKSLHFSITFDYGSLPFLKLFLQCLGAYVPCCLLNLKTHSPALFFFPPRVFLKIHPHSSFFPLLFLIPRGQRLFTSFSPMPISFPNSRPSLRQPVFVWVFADIPTSAENRVQYLSHIGFSEWTSSWLTEPPSN